MSKPDPTFEAPWHAEVFAMTVHLQESGLFSWADWTQCFGATLAVHGLDKELDGGADYLIAWVEALEKLLASIGLADASILGSLKDAWADAYLKTPHGQPVKIEDD